MNITNAEYFTFNVDNSLLLVGQTGTGKSVLEEKYLKRLITSHTADELKFVLLDMTGVDFSDIRENHPEYILEDIKFDAEKGLELLNRFATTVAERMETRTSIPLLVLCIEECDMAAVDQKRFDEALIKINGYAKVANVKVIFSTSRPAPDVLSKLLINSFDVILAGTLGESDYEYLGIPMPREHNRYDFIVTSKDS